MLDTVLDILSDGRRRKILYSMNEEDSDIFGYDELAEELVDEDSLSSHKKDDFMTQMTHVHLPKLKDGGVVEYDQRSETVRYTADEEITEILDFLNSYE